jgi:hypothetical protein
MDDRRGSITVGALLGTGAATLGLAFVGFAGVGSDLRAADAARNATPPVITEDLGREEHSPKWDGHSPLPTPAVGPVRPSPSPSPTPDPQKEL